MTGASSELRAQGVRVALGLAVVVPATAAWLTLVGDPSFYLHYEMPPGQLAYVVSRFLGLLGFGLLWLQAVLALAGGASGPLAVLRIGVPAHRRLGFLTLAAIAGHVVLFVVATSLRAEHLTLHWLLPRFDQGYYVLRVGLGSIAFWALIGVVAAGLRRRASPRFRWLHLLWLPAFLLTYVHSTSIGSETRLGVLDRMYSFYALTFVVALLVRLGSAGLRGGAPRDGQSAGGSASS